MKKISLAGTIKGLVMCMTIGLFFGACSTADNRPANNTSATTTTTTNNGNATTTTNMHLSKNNLV